MGYPRGSLMDDTDGALAARRNGKRGDWVKKRNIQRWLCAVCIAVGALMGAGIAAVLLGAWEMLAADGVVGMPHTGARLALYVVLCTLCGGLCGIFSGMILRFVQANVQRAERALEGAPAQQVLTSVAGLIAGLIIALLTTQLFRALEPKEFFTALTVVVYIVMGYLGASVGARRYKEWPACNLLGKKQDKPVERDAQEGLAPKILDTSVIIDGRIYDICKTGFLEGTLVVPQFVLAELRHIADSGDALRRNRGRRGLDVLSRMQKEPGLRVEVSEADFEDVEEVDVKLLKLAQQTGGIVMTNDYNLNKVAAVTGVRVLNINELANAVKPVVLPGEEMTVQIVREGKEPGQGVGYLEDGTMIVVDNARRYVGETLSVVVTTVLQTAAGRMIFTKMKPVERAV